MRPRRRLGLLVVVWCLILGASLGDVAASAAAGGSSSTTPAPKQLTNAYPLGSQTIQGGAQTTSTATSQTTPSEQTSTAATLRLGRVVSLRDGDCFACARRDAMSAYVLGRVHGIADQVRFAE